MEHDTNNHHDQGLGKWVVAILALIALVLAIFGGMILIGNHGSGSITEAQASPAAATASGTVATEGDRVVVENGVVKFYFASGSTALAAGADKALADVVAGAKAGKKVVVSGFHDSTGNAQTNAEVAKKRAEAVHNAVMALGVPADQIELRKPQNTEGTGDAAEARRVEVVLE